MFTLKHGCGILSVVVKRVSQGEGTKKQVRDKIKQNTLNAQNLIKAS